jgi:hypothetical protein
MLQNIPKEKVLEIVRQGPTFPAKVSKQLGGGADTLLIGAILSTLISTGDVKVSSLKIGGSPLYYVPEQEPKLEEYLDHLNDKDRKTFNLLKDSKVLQDSEQDPLTRVSLRGIKDFAKLFEITVQGQKFLFWRFYTEPLSSAESLAKKAVKQVSIEQPGQELRSEPKPEPRSSLVIEPKPIFVEKVVEKPIAKPSEIQAVLEEHKLPVQGPELEQKHVRAKREHHEKTLKPKSHQPKVPKTPKVPKPKKPAYDFFEIIKAYFASKGLDIISKEKIKKTEYDIILKDNNTDEYIYCKAKDKSSISEGDLAPALIFAQSKKMLCLFVSMGELTKKAESMMGKELSGLRFERIIMNQV